MKYHCYRFDKNPGKKDPGELCSAVEWMGGTGIEIRIKKKNHFKVYLGK